MGLPDGSTGDEEIVLAMVLEPGAALEPVRAALDTVLPASAFPDRVVAIDEVPRAGRTHKPDREALRCALR